MVPPPRGSLIERYAVGVELWTGRSADPRSGVRQGEGRRSVGVDSALERDPNVVRQGQTRAASVRQSGSRLRDTGSAIPGLIWCLEPRPDRVARPGRSTATASTARSIIRA